MKIAFLLLGALLLFLFLNQPALIDPDEARYAEGAREMLVLRDYLIPHLNYIPRVNKPILFYWLICGSYKIFGINEFAARFPSAMFALILLLGLYFWTKRYLDQKTAFLSSLVLLSSPAFFVVARLAIIDTVFAALILLSLFSFWHCYSKDKFMYTPFVLTGLSLAAKGPVGWLLILITIAAFSITKRSFKFLRLAFRPKGILTILIIGGLWYLMLFNKIGALEFKNLIFRETLGRFKDGFVHKEPFFYYFPLILLGFMPWSIFLIFLKRVNYKNEAVKFLAIFGIVTYLFFSLCKTKLPTYILPLFPVLAVFSASIINSLWRERLKSPLIVAMVLIIIFFILKFLPQGIYYPLQKDSITGFSIFVLLFSLPFVFLFNSKLKVQFPFLFLLTFLIYFFLLFNFKNEFSDYRSCKALVNEEVLKLDNIKALNFFEPSLVFYSGKKVENINAADIISPGYLAIKKEDLPLILRKQYLYKVVSETKKYYFLRVQKLQN